MFPRFRHLVLFSSCRFFFIFPCTPGIGKQERWIGYPHLSALIFRMDSDSGRVIQTNVTAFWSRYVYLVGVRQRK